MSNSDFDRVREFHNKFGLRCDSTPALLTEQEQKFRITCLREELGEYEEAVENKDLAEQFDALIDLVYFALGTAHRNGFNWEAGFSKVHKANMLKSVDSGKQRREFELEVTKPEGWKPPVLDDLIEQNSCERFSKGEFIGEYKGLITLDGADATGKTTLAKRIVELFGGEYIHLTWSPELEEVMHNYRTAAIHYAANLAKHTVVVLERPWLSHPIYSEVYRGGEMHDYTSWRDLCQFDEDLSIISCPSSSAKWFKNYEQMVISRNELFSKEDNRLMLDVFDKFANSDNYGKVTDTTIHYDMFEVETPCDLDIWIDQVVKPYLRSK